MFFSEYLNKITTVFGILLLSSEMQAIATQNTNFEDRVQYYSSETNSKEVSYNNARHHASIRLKEYDHNFGDGHICSGVVIGPSAVLTTAQCIYNYNEYKPYHPSELKVVLASTRRYQHQEATLIYSVTHCYQPETFNILNLKDNLAILMLEHNIPENNERVNPITFVHSEILSTKWHDKQNGDKFQVTTWLTTQQGLLLNHLMILNVSKVSDETCTQYYGKTVFTTGMLCVQDSESSFKDFGSPLFVSNKLVGLRSFATGSLSPDIYTEVSHHAKWIRSVIGDGSNQNGQVWGVLGFLLLTFLALRRIKL